MQSPAAALPAIAAPRVSAPTSTRETAKPRWMLALVVGGAAAVLGAFMTWASITAPFFGTINISGTDGDGKLTGVAGAAVVFFGWLAFHRGPQTWAIVLALLAGLGITAVGGWDAIDIQSAADDSGGIALVRVGPGLWLTIVAGVTVMASSITGLAKS